MCNFLSSRAKAQWPILNGLESLSQEKGQETKNTDQVSWRPSCDISHHLPQPPPQYPTSCASPQPRLTGPDGGLFRGLWIN